MSGDKGHSMEHAGGEECFLPNFCSVRMVLAIVVSAELLAVVLSLSNARTLAGFAEELSLYSLLVQWIALAAAALLCLLRSWLCRLGETLAGLGAWFVLLAVTLLVSEVAFRLLNSFGVEGGHLLFLLKSLVTSAIIAALLLRYLYLQHLWRQQVEAESRARLQALQSRIRPHFLFNSMNTIASLTRSRPELAEQVVHDLADLFRASLSDAQRMSTLGDELELARGYLRIEEQRLGERLRVEWDLEELPEGAPMPALTLQPLLENAVYHGIEPSIDPGMIRIIGRYRRQRVELSIRNSLPPKCTDSRREGSRLALENTRQRLEGVFEERGGLSVSELDGEYQVRIFFPTPEMTAG